MVDEWGMGIKECVAALIGLYKKNGAVSCVGIDYCLIPIQPHLSSFGRMEEIQSPFIPISHSSTMSCNWVLSKIPITGIF